ncbi:hypothetical protein JXB41_04705 [Candidatus Woesearchaeota archaeon]|nr:hypothetical protein [Candidatus Woesearchaeota archaeon]
MDTKKGTLTELKRKIKLRKPKFTRQSSYKLKRLKNKDKWKKPKGYHSKLKARKAHKKLVSSGYGSPLGVRHCNNNGLAPVLVISKSHLFHIDNKEQGIVISGKLGLKKKLELIQKAHEMKITILNITDPEKYVQQMKQKIEEKKSKKEKSIQDKTKKEEKRLEKKESIEDKLSEEEKKRLEKKEIDRLLTKKF